MICRCINGGYKVMHQPGEQGQYMPGSESEYIWDPNQDEWPKTPPENEYVRGLERSLIEKMKQVEALLEELRKIKEHQKLKDEI